MEEPTKEPTKKLSISTAWSEAARFVAREAALLAPVAILLLAVPSVLIGLMTPNPEVGETPSLGFMLLAIPIAVVTGIGSLAITVLALGDGITVAEALRTAARRFVPLLLASMLLGLASIVLLLPILLAGGVPLAAGAAPDPAAAGSVLLLVIVLMPVFLYVWARLSLMAPVAAGERQGPIAIITRSWALTRGVGWKLAAAYLLLALALVVLMMVALLLTGILVAGLGGAPEAGSFGEFVMLLVQGVLTAAFTVYFQAFGARIYAQLAGGRTTGS